MTPPFSAPPSVAWCAALLAGALSMGCDRRPDAGEAATATPGEKASDAPAPATVPHEQAGHVAAKPVDSSGAHHHHHDPTELAAGPSVAGTSVFHVESTWTTQAGKPLRLGDLAGSPTVLAMVYTHCEHACPQIVADMRVIEKGLSSEARAATKFVLASIDPERDTVERLNAFAKRASLAAPQWTLIRAGESEVRELAAVLGVKYQPLPPSDFAHSNLITVLDPAGVVVHQQEGLGAEPRASIAAVEAQAKAK